MATFKLQYGTYVFPPGFSYTEIGSVIAAQMTKLPHFPGAAVAPAYPDGRHIKVAGTFVVNRLFSATTATLVRDQWDGLMAALTVYPQNLYTDSQRYFRNVYPVSMPRKPATMTGAERVIEVEIEFETGDPFWYDSTVNSSTQALTASGQTQTIMVGGIVQAAPVFTLTVAATGSGGFLVANGANSMQFAVNGSFNAGDVVIVDCLNMTVTLNGTTNLSIFGGQFMACPVGNNTISYTWGGGSVGLTSAEIAWNNRYM